MTEPASAGPTIDTDPIEFVRRNWAAAGQRQAEQFAAAVSIFRAHQLISAEFARVLKPYGINRTAYHVMSALYMSEEMTRPLGRVSKNVMIHPATLTLLMEKLESRDLVRRSRHPTDRRTTLATLTESGAAMVAEASAALADRDFGLIEVTDEDAHDLTEMLQHTLRSLGDTLAG